MIIEVKKNALIIDGLPLTQPITIAALQEILGQPRNTERIVNSEGLPPSTLRRYTWDKLGIIAFTDDKCKYIPTIALQIEKSSTLFPELPTDFFTGEVTVGKKKTTDEDFGWKKDKGNLELIKKVGDYEICLPCLLKDGWTNGRMEITYHAPKVKNLKYEALLDVYEPMLFENLNFKLAVINVLMYDTELLKPKFDIYEFAEAYPKKNIDTNNDRPLRAAADYFKKLQIPKELGAKVEEIYMDGGNDIYQQIAPNWDGEDGVFDVNAISIAELEQLPNLKKITLMSGKYTQLSKILEKYKIECKPL